MNNNSFGGFLNYTFDSKNNCENDYYCFESGRSALYVILLKLKPSNLKIPAYTCNAVLEPIKKLNIPYEFYNLNNELLPNDISLMEDEFIIINNYFGLIQEKISALKFDFSKVIIDNSQFFFFDDKNSNHLSFYSPRKFLGLPDGGLINKKSINLEDYSDLEVSFSYSRVKHLFQSIEKSKEDLYFEYLKSEKSLSNNKIGRMSLLTTKMLNSYDLKLISDQRKSNFNLIHETLKGFNSLSYLIDSSKVYGALCYPLIIKNRKNLKSILISKNIYVPTFWPDIEERIKFKDGIEFSLLNNLIALPIDQKNNLDDISKMLEIILKILK